MHAYHLKKFFSRIDRNSGILIQGTLAKKVKVGAEKDNDLGFYVVVGQVDIFFSQHLIN